MKKQFDLQYYIDHPDVKVVTRLGQPVRIICTDAKSTKPDGYKVIALVSYSGHEDEFINRYKCDGSYLEGREHSSDLFFDIPDPVKKRVPLTFEDMVERVKSGKIMWLVRDSNTIYNIVDFDVENVYYVFGDVQQMPHLSYEELMNGMTFANGDPTWKEVEE